MRKYLIPLLFLSLFISIIAKTNKDEKLKKKAEQLAHKYIIVDTHIDVPYRLHHKMEDISNATGDGNFDYPRAVKGGLNAPFMSIYIPARYENSGGGKELADTLIAMVKKIVAEHPDKFALANSPKEVEKNFAAGKISMPMGMENGTPIEGDLDNLKYFYKQGIRYITLTHSKNNHIGDSSYDTERKWHGLSPFGKKLVKAMNKIGMMIDISHVSDETFYDVLKVTKSPVIASHSSCRYFTPDFERNMSDDMIKALAKNGGVIQITFGSAFISGEINQKRNEISSAIKKYLSKHKLTQEEANKFEHNYRKEHPYGFANVSEVADHIDHVVKFGIDYVGLGSDFDGVGDSLPTGLKDVSMYPNLIYELLKRGYSDEDIQKICSGNILRVWEKIQSLSTN